MQRVRVRTLGARLALLAGSALLFAIVAGPAIGQSSTNYTVRAKTLNNGVDTMSSLSFRMNSSLGDSLFYSPLTSTSFRLSPGLWYALGGPTPLLVGAASRRVHGTAGTFDLPLTLVAPPAVNHNPTTEPRIGPSQTIVFTFDKPIIAATATVTEGTATAGTPTFSGNDVVVALSGVIDMQYVTVGLTNVASADGGTGGSGIARAGFLLGDVNGSRVVTVADLGLVNAQLAQFVTAANYLKDVNASGTLTVADKGLTNANLARALPAP